MNLRYCFNDLNIQGISTVCYNLISNGFHPHFQTMSALGGFISGTNFIII